MEGFEKVFRRRSIRLKGYDYSQPGAYFVTICTKNQYHYLGDIIGGRMKLSEIGEIINQFWIEISYHFDNVHLDGFIVMPNHLHGIIMIDVNCRGEVPSPYKGTLSNSQGRETLPLQQKRPLGHVIGYFKYQSTKRINKIRGLPGVTIWQRNYYEHVIRNEDELNRIREYIINNPLQWQFDRENPMRIQDKTYEKLWGPIEEVIYGEKGGIKEAL